MNIHILDGSWYLYRAYYAFPQLTNEHGQNVNAVYGFFRMLFRNFQQKPDVLIIARDAPVKTLRHAEYEEYKANRPATPEDFKHQIGMVKQLVKELGIHAFEIPGYEADDIIATLVDTRKKQWHELTIISADKDLKQMIDDHVVVADPMKGETTNKASFTADFGFTPELMIDYLALVGDASDNIPGAQGIGPKTAQTLVSKYWGLDQIYAQLPTISASTAQKLEASRDTVYKGKKLITAMMVPWLESAKPDEYLLAPNFTRLNQVLVIQHGFHSLKKVIDDLKNTFTKPAQQSLFG